MRRLAAEHPNPSVRVNAACATNDAALVAALVKAEPSAHWRSQMLAVLYRFRANDELYAAATGSRHADVRVESVTMLGDRAMLEELAEHAHEEAVRERAKFVMYWADNA